MRTANDIYGGKQIMAGHVYRRIRANFSAVAMAAMTLTVVACGGGGDAGGASVSAPAAVGSVNVTLANAQLQVGAQQTAAAEVRSTTSAVLTGRAITWASSNSGVAAVSDGGVITGVAPGTVSITATTEGKVGTASLTVVLAPVNAITVSAPATTLVTDRALQTTAVLRDERGATLSGRTVSWSSSAPTVATVNDAGLVTGVSAGSATISASSEGRSGTLVFTVVPPPVNSVSIALSQSIIPQGSTAAATVQLRDDRNVALTGRAVTFTSSDATVASVSNVGVITALAVGTTTITAASEGRSASATLSVIQAPVASVLVTLPQTSVLPGNTVQAQALLRDAGGRTLTGRAVTYASSNPAVAGVNSTGLITAIAPGEAVISATSQGQTGQAALQVVVPVASVVFNGSTRVKVGDSYSYTVTARAADGTVLDRPVAFRVREASRAQMAPGGALVPLQRGSFTIVAQIDGTDWDASYSAYDWEAFTSGGDGFLSLESDARVSNRFGTLQYTSLVMSCSPTSRFFLWVSVPHMVTANGLVAYGLDNGSLVSQFWNELSPNFSTLWTPGSSASVKSFAQTIASARRFILAFTEFNSVARAMTFRVTGLNEQLPSLLMRCPNTIVQGGQAGSPSELPDVRPSLVRSAARTASSPDTRVRDDARSRAEGGPVVTSSPFIAQWPTWTVPEATVAHRVKR
ncbi:MAG: Ig domain-containing protein [Gemmatimonas sp.]|nr:Ig domain-containing protein [Gemmatimonas sp.]